MHHPRSQFDRHDSKELDWSSKRRGNALMRGVEEVGAIIIVCTRLSWEIGGELLVLYLPFGHPSLLNVDEKCIRL